MENVHIRLATRDDLQSIDEIYNWYIPRSTCTYQDEAEPFAKRIAWFEHHGPKHPITVAEISGEIVGWGSLSEFRDRAAYRRTVEDSVYIRNDMRGKGFGSAILQDLIDRARTLGHHTIIAGADGEQTESIKLHERFGFRKVAHFEQVGFKFERWLDVVFLQLML